MRTPQQMAQYSPRTNNWQLQGPITYAEFVYIRTEILKRIEEKRTEQPFWDFAVVSESLYRDRRSVFMKYVNRMKKEQEQA